MPMWRIRFELFFYFFPLEEFTSESLFEGGWWGVCEKMEFFWDAVLWVFSWLNEK